MTRVGVVSLGCPRNVVDTESVLGRLRSRGYEIVDMEHAEVAVINTCAFVEDAKKESIDTILDVIALKKEGRIRKVIVYGCLSQRYKDSLRKELPEIDAFVGKLELCAAPDRYGITPRHYAYVKICEGCVNACSFCVIPRIKGALKSLDIERVVEQARAAGPQVVELNIVGQDITGYGLDSPKNGNLETLVKELLTTVPAKWIRLLYLHPSRISDGLLDVMRSDPRVCAYVDVPIQHSNDRILKLMNRDSTRDSLLRLIEKIRRRVPGVALRTSVIAGFPTETESEFEDLLSFIREVRFERLGAFIYSREEQTPAYRMKQVPQPEKERRFDLIMRAQADVAREVNARQVGETLEVLIDEVCDEGYLGRTRFDAPEVDGQVAVASARKLVPGDIVKVRILDTFEYDLRGVAVEPLQQGA